jgi:hypothetical protein
MQPRFPGLRHGTGTRTRDERQYSRYECRGRALEGYFGIGAEIEWRTGFDPDPELADPLMTFKAPRKGNVTRR